MSDPLPINVWTEEFALSVLFPYCVDGVVYETRKEFLDEVYRRQGHWVPSNYALERMNAGLAKVFAQTADAEINLDGDSWFYGFYSVAGECMPVVDTFKQLLPSGLNPVKGWIVLNSSSDLWPTDTWTLSPSWAASAPATMGFGSSCGKNATNPVGAIVCNPREVCDQFDVLCVCAPGYGSLTIQATGGASVTFDCNRAVGTYKVTCSAAALALNTVSITGTGQVIPFAVRARNTTKKQLYVNNLGAGGSQMARWDDPPEGYNSVDALAYTNPCLSVVGIGINDAWANWSPAEYRQSYETFLDLRNPQGGDVILCAPGQVNPLAVGDKGLSVSNLLQQYREVVKDLGKARNLQVIDIQEVIPYATADWADWSHPKREKYPLLAMAIDKEIR